MTINENSISIDLSNWISFTIPGQNIEWILRYKKSLSQSERNIAASIIATFDSLLRDYTTEKAVEILRMLRKSIKGEK